MDHLFLSAGLASKDPEIFSPDVNELRLAGLTNIRLFPNEPRPRKRGHARRMASETSRRAEFLSTWLDPAHDEKLLVEI